jgi:uncharacterized protein (TIGR00661 family)
MKRARLLWGVCGIGLGHARRQLPLIQHFGQHADISIFTYGSGIAFFEKAFAGQVNIRVHPVSVPYWIGQPSGLDFMGAAVHPANATLDFAANARAMAQAQQHIKTPHLVVSDYEPIAAQYAYAMGAPLVTLDQQSKYLGARLPTRLAGTGSADEVQRLSMFFPKAEARIACSFFKVAQQGRDVQLIAPILGSDIKTLKRKPLERPLVLVYLSEQLANTHQRAQIMAVLAQFKDVQFAVYVPENTIQELPVANIRLYPQGSKSFLSHLASCHGIISTAGHGLLSEAMYLGIPVLALPLKFYEQQMNAKVIADGGFGLCAHKLTRTSLQKFLRQLPDYAAAIARDKKTLLRGDGTAAALDVLKRFLP